MVFCKEWLLWGNCNFSNACLIYSSNVCVSNSIFVYPQLNLTSLFTIFFRLITLCLYLACASLLTWSFVPHLLKLMMHISSQVSIYSRVFSSIVFSWSGSIDSKRLFFLPSILTKYHFHEEWLWKGFGIYTKLDIRINSSNFWGEEVGAVSCDFIGRDWELYQKVIIMRIAVEIRQEFLEYDICNIEDIFIRFLHDILFSYFSVISNMHSSFYSQTNELYQLAAVAFCLLSAWVRK